MNLHNIHSAYFLGIGGIGMSALALFLQSRSVKVYGYDRVHSSLTQSLEEKGIAIVYDDQVESIPGKLLSIPKERVLIVVTPAIPTDNPQWNYFRQYHFEIVKRSILLGEITKSMNTLAVAGTHGKTTTSTYLAHLITESGTPCNAFLGGMSVNYNTNLLLAENSDTAVVEADEFDRSFLTLSPNVAVVTSTDADHMDIYGSADSLKDSFGAFVNRVQPGGKVILKSGLPFSPPGGVKKYTYSISEEADFMATGISIRDGKYFADIIGPGLSLQDVEFGIPGNHNVENGLAAAAVAHLEGISPTAIRNGLSTFKGVKRRFEYIFRGSQIYIDDYAHHPTEINACIDAIRHLYPGKRVTAVFQPHLFSRTNDFLNEFAQSLSKVDSLVLMEIYPAREKPIPGINSGVLLEKVNLQHKVLLNRNDIPSFIKNTRPEVLVTLGAGDIDQLVEPLKAVMYDA